MENFEFVSPTHFVFGKGAEEQVGSKLAERGARTVLLHFGGQSAVKSGLIDRVKASLDAQGIKHVELGGVRPNPEITLAREGIALCKEHDVDWVLAVGGGSVIDSAKAIAMGVATKTDPWQFASTGTKPDTTLPVGTVLTLAASGSESSNSCVLTNEEAKEKRGITSETNRPRISFLDPENTYTVSKFQTGCGIVDIMMHTLERYLTPEGGESDITDRIAEGLLIAVRDAGRRAIANPRDYEARASLMWAGSVSHNDYTGCGRKRLFPVHKLEHELSAFRDEIAHGAGLSVLFPAWALYEMKNDFPRFAQLANRVFGVEMDFHHPERTAREGILTMKRFFEEIGMPTHLAQLGIKPENYAQLAANTVRTVKGPVKSYSALDEQAIIEIYKLAE